MTSSEELFAIAERLNKVKELASDDEVTKPLAALEDAANQVGRAFSGSWMGYHARVYYATLESPPAGAHFSQEWGLMDTISPSHGSRGQWREFTDRQIDEHIRTIAGSPSLVKATNVAREADDVFEASRSDISSVLQTALDLGQDGFLERLKDDLDGLTTLSPLEIADRYAPKGQIMTRDSIVVGQGTKVPPHIAKLAEVRSLQHVFAICEAAQNIALKAGSHLERKLRTKRRSDRIGTNVFIGHGQSLVWRDLKDFLQDRLKLPWDEFNRVPVAGITNVARLSEMLDAAAIAFLVLTAEEETSDGRLQARLNVVHEAGLFQGRLGFTRAIVMLEDGCEGFSNIDGLGQIRFPAGNISTSFEEIRRVLEREGLVPAT